MFSLWLKAVKSTDSKLFQDEPQVDISGKSVHECLYKVAKHMQLCKLIYCI